MADGPSRTPPEAVRRLLRAEVGFGCPVPDCRSPFLEYHHFDPEWHVEHHHRPEGMIPLCPTHHGQAEAFTVEQLRKFKASAHDEPAAGRFQWLRRDLAGVVGGNVYYETPILVQYREEPVVWFERDEHGHALLNLRMLTTVGKEDERIRVTNNDFIVRGTPLDFHCPRNGRRLHVKYENGDYLRIEFREVTNTEAAARLFPFNLGGLDLRWPITFVTVAMGAGGTFVEFTPKSTRLPGGNVMQGCVMLRSGVGLSFE